ncbi:unnamed protein product [Spirodela intermedia]|uniref:Homeobox domain-containing protein n=1 Tax=Spirodela intermedia TaxID=51605 RepID=A0A7I8I9C8_SPIIN|nr:unnamed protein product [Spirodela intermedia]CAA6654255.1 unnamed protein product [Spirodela intermedia]
MELVPRNLEDGLEELQTFKSKECLDRFLDAQRDLFRCQVDQLQKIVIYQCKVTGAAGALSINIGKKPRDLLNPKAIKYMQSIFSIKDSVSKKETREISALCGVTITQVREFFASQRSRVRKLVRLSREKVTKSSASDEISIGCPLNSGLAAPVTEQACEPSVVPISVEGCAQVPMNGIQQLDATQLLNHVSVEAGDTRTTKEGLSCAPQEETIPGLDADDKNFLEHIFSLMKKEETFSGQVKLIEWIMQIHTSAVLHRFLTKGGVLILATWLSQAALEEQTTVILAIFRVLCHLPLHKALPTQMSAILQTVNKLRFYRTSDISNKARVLLSRWSKLFIRSQAMKRPLSVKYSSDSQKEMIRKQRISEILSDGSWLSKVDLPEDILALSYEGSAKNRKLDSKQALKLLPATSNESSKKQARSVSCPKMKERRKVLLVEQPDHRNPGRSVPVARAVPTKSSRPMSSDDIQKAKMHAIFMQRKYGNTDTSSDGQNTINQKVSNASSADKIPKLSESEKDEDKTEFPHSKLEELPLTSISLPTVADSKPSTSGGLPSLVSSEPSTVTGEPSLEKLRRECITWQTPPVIRISELWSIGNGESSKEMDVQTARIRREQEARYPSADAIPANAKDPWDVEMDFDDSLTPEIPTEPPPEADAGVDAADAAAEPAAPAASAPPAEAATAAPVAGPDLELLAVLLKNPSCNLSNAETVALLDVLKQSNGGLAGILSAAAGAPPTHAAEPATSLPSPTPPSERARVSRALTRRSRISFLASARRRPPPPPLLLRSLPSGNLYGSYERPVCRPSPPSSASSSSGPPPPHRLSTAAAQRRPTSRPALSPGERRRQQPLFPSLLQQHHHQEALSLEQQMQSRKAPPLLPTPPRAQSPLLPEPPALRSRWPTGATSGAREAPPPPGAWHARQSGLLETPPQDHHHHHQYQQQQQLVSVFAAGPAQARAMLQGRMGDPNVLVDRSELEAWSPERSSGGGFRPAGGFPDARRAAEYAWGGDVLPVRRPRLHQLPGPRDHRHRSGRRWRDRERRP